MQKCSFMCKAWKYLLDLNRCYSSGVKGYSYFLKMNLETENCFKDALKVNSSIADLLDKAVWIEVDPHIGLFCAERTTWIGGGTFLDLKSLGIQCQSVQHERRGASNVLVIDLAPLLFTTRVGLFPGDSGRMFKLVPIRFECVVEDGGLVMTDFHFFDSGTKYNQHKVHVHKFGLNSGD